MVSKRPVAEHQRRVEQEREFNRQLASQLAENEDVLVAAQARIAALEEQLEHFFRL